MNSTDLRCASCGKLRKEIYADKIKSYVFCAAGGLLIGISIALMNGGKKNEVDFYNETTSSGNNTLSYVLLGVGILSAVVGMFFYAKVSQKLKSWWWA